MLHHPSECCFFAGHPGHQEEHGSRLLREKVPQYTLTRTIRIKLEQWHAVSAALFCPVNDTEFASEDSHSSEHEAIALVVDTQEKSLPLSLSLLPCGPQFQLTPVGKPTEPIVRARQLKEYGHSP